jgi:hypothetical protein
MQARNSANRTWRTALLLASLAGLFCFGAAQPEASNGVERYFQCQIAAREATIVGLEERAALLAKPATTDRELDAASQRSSNRVDAAFIRCGYSSDQLAAYAHTYNDALKAWLAANPATQTKLDTLRARVQTLASQMPQRPAAAR